MVAESFHRHYFLGVRRRELPKRRIVRVKWFRHTFDIPISYGWYPLKVDVPLQAHGLRLRNIATAHRLRTKPLVRITLK